MIMAKKQETFSFIDQPRWLKGSIHNEFVTGKKADYAVQLVPAEALPEAREYFAQASTVAVVHLPLGVIGAAPYRALEHDTIEGTPDPIIGVQLWTDGKRAGHFVIMRSGGRFTRIRRRRSKPLTIKIQKSFAREAFNLAMGLRTAYEAGDLDPKPEPAEIPTRKGRSWLWSARWRELHADPEWKVRPPWLSNDGRVHYLGSSQWLAEALPDQENRHALSRKERPGSAVNVPRDLHRVNSDRSARYASSVENGLEMQTRCERVLLIDSRRSRAHCLTMHKQISLRLPTELWTRAERKLDAIKERPEYQGVPLSTSRVLIMAIARGLPQLTKDKV
jgi:hypothetical protein